MAARARHDLSIKRRAWGVSLATAIAAEFPQPPADRPSVIARTIFEHERFEGAWPILRREALAGPMPRMTSRMVERRWPVPVIHDEADLAVYLGLRPNRLLALADARSMERGAQSEALRNYRYRWVPKAGGGVRLIEAPKPTLKHAQRVILREILNSIPLPDEVHGFRPEHSVFTYAAPHAGQRVVLRFDIEDFFLSVEARRVYGVFRMAGYPEPVARLLTGLVSNSVPRGQAVDGVNPRKARALRQPHLPQGAPTSPMLANIIAARLDRRLSGVARRFDATYTRYADDLAFSGGGDLFRRSTWFAALVRAIAEDEGFTIRRDKTRIMPSAQRQRLGGLVVNEAPAVSRRERDQLRAVLHDAIVNGPVAANRAGVDDFRNHLLGRISWVAAAKPAHGAKMRAQFDRIVW